MPFKLKLKKTRHYNVVSKSLFVVSIELLDGVIVECTLAIESTGQECLENVCQRLVINQPEFFGLRYINRMQQPRWVHLERPLKRQLDKHAYSQQLYLRIMYYVGSGTSLITDEVTRLHYFLQLKNDLTEGRIICDCRQAVILAAFSRQAEYGNHDCERHTVEYLKNLLSFPKQIIEGGQIFDVSSLAESGRLEYLTAAVIQHHQALQNMSQIQAEEGYINVCQQLSGYGQETFVAREQRGGDEVMIAVSLAGIMVATETSDAPHLYRWADITNVINHKRTFSIECQNSTDSVTFVLPTPEDGKYIWRMCVLQHTFYMKHKQKMASVQPQFDMDIHMQNKFQEDAKSDHRSFLESSSRLNLAQPLGPTQRAHSTSCIDLVSSNAHLHQSRDVEKLKALLPSYRAAPDYETAIQQKVLESRSQPMRYSNEQPLTKPILYGSHPDMHRTVQYPDVTNHTANHPYALKFVGHNALTNLALNPKVQANVNAQMHHLNVYKPPPPYPSNGLASNSTPDLALASQTIGYQRGFINTQVSGSSPDLVSNRALMGRPYVSHHHNTPHFHEVIHYNHVHSSHGGTYNNLAVVDASNPHIMMDRQLSNSVQKVYDDRGNIVYSIPQTISYQSVAVTQNQGLSTNKSEEPIYENVPLPWLNKSENRNIPSSLDKTDSISNGAKTFNTANLSTHINNDSFSSGTYANAPIIRQVSETNKDTNPVNKSITEIDIISNSIDCLSVSNREKNVEETPYQSLSTHNINIPNADVIFNNNVSQNDTSNVTSITIDASDSLRGSYGSNKNSITAPEKYQSLVNKSSYSTNLPTASSTHLSSTIETSMTSNKSSKTKEKKRRRWGVFMGRGDKNSEVKSATLGRDRHKKTSTNAAVTPEKYRWSTGLSKLPPSIETLCQLLERMISDPHQMEHTYENISKGREVNADITTALLPEYSPHNGFTSDHLPYEDNRVRLNPTPENKHGYVNASQITMTVGCNQRFYVVCRGPSSQIQRRDALTSTAEAELIWGAVWTTGARLIAYVGGQEQPIYLPIKSLITTQFHITLESRSQSTFGYTSRIRLKRSNSHEPRAIWHIHYYHWPNVISAPECPQLFLSFLSELNSLRMQIASETLPPHNPNTPVFICDARGAGPAGTVLATDLLAHTLDHNQDLDIPQTVSLLNQQRANMIENVEQYTFIHRVLLQYLGHVRLI